MTRVPARPRRGMALVAVLWVVAALSLLVMGVAGSARTQIRAASLQRDLVSGQALGDAAIHLALQTLLTEQKNRNEVHTFDLEYQGVPITVRAMPLNGLISLNVADDGLLALALQGAGLPASQARALAQDIVRWRDTPLRATAGIGQAPDAAANAAQRPGFEALEDLMLVPGIDYDLYARLAPMLTADGRDSGINPDAATDGVRAALSGGSSGAPLSQLRYAGSSGTDLYRLQASVPLDEGKILRFTRDVAFRRDNVRGLPWHTLREDRRILSVTD